MYEKCIKCDRIGLSCVPNLMTLPFPDLIQWCDKRQKYLGWTNQILADRSKVPVGTINRIKQGDYSDCKYSTIRSILIALIGGTTDEFPCNEQVEKELKQMEDLEKQAAKLSVAEAEVERLSGILSKMDDQHRNDIRIIKEEYRQQIKSLREDYQEQIAFLKEQLRAWQTRDHKS